MPEKKRYNFTIVKAFCLMAVIYLVVGTLVGVIISAQMAWPTLTPPLPYLTFGRLRPLHTNVVIFAFAGCVLFASAFYIVQRTNGVKIWSEKLAWFSFVTWNMVIVGALVTLPLGITQGKEYAELEWPLDILILVAWVAFLFNFMVTVSKRKMTHVYVANWFFISMLIMITYLHVINSLAIPVGLFKSYSIFSGVHDAMVQWWYGHNAVGFFLTAGFLGMMYYFVPVRSGQPIYSYRLSVLHFWSLVFGYVWIGSHHLHYTALPEWAGSLGVAISVAMLFPSWGGMVNGLLTIGGAWHKLKEDYVLRFFFMSLVFYGLTTLEGPIMSIRSVNAFTHYTEWTIGHVHAGTLGWVSMAAIGAIYHMIRKLWNRELYSNKLVRVHFWLTIAGTITYVCSMWGAGATQAIMWRAFDDYGSLSYTFTESVAAMHPYYAIRFGAGLTIFVGASLMLFNMLMTIKGQREEGRGKKVEKREGRGKREEERKRKTPYKALQGRRKIAQGQRSAALGNRKPLNLQERLESNLFAFFLFLALLLSIGGIVTVVPLFYLKNTVEDADVHPELSGVRPYTALELAGRDVYLREGCYACHSQMIRPLVEEKERYGHYSLAVESVYDHPFQWGSKRTGPDLARVGGKYSDEWHAAHLEDPRSLVPGSIMPRFPWLKNAAVDAREIVRRIEAMRTLGVPYTDADIADAVPEVMGKSEMDALVKYLQVLGTMITFEEGKDYRE